MPITVKRLCDALGAEIHGLDLRDTMDEATMAQILDAWREHLVLLFRNQDLTEEDQVRFARRFGALEERPRKRAVLADAEATDYPGYTMLISNIRDHGRLIGSLPDGEVHFHSDACFSRQPPSGTFLYGLEVPSEGGETVLANMYKAYEALPVETRRLIKDKTALNVYMLGACTRDSHVPDFDADPHYTHPVVRTHPETGRDLLYVNRLCTWRLNGCGAAEGYALLEELLDHIDRPDFHYAHKWRRGDLLLWDNRCTQHARNDFSDAERRLLRRVAVESTDVPFNRDLPAP